MLTDTELLLRWIRDRSEEAFGELVSRHVNLVYRAAVRQLAGDVHLARDVTQLVFTTFAVKAPTLGRDAVVAGWLYNTTRYTVANLARAERRRKKREQEAVLMHHDPSDTAVASDWDRLRPVLDDVLKNLSQPDRDAILLRYFEGRAYSEIGAALRVKEDAARVRVDRALEKLRLLLGRRGIASTSAALSTLFSSQVAGAAPAGLAASVSSAALAAASAATSAVTPWLTIFFMSKSTVAVVSVIVVAGIVTAISEVRASRLLSTELLRLESDQAEMANLRRENQRLAEAATASRTPNPDVAELGKLRTRLAEAANQPAAPGSELKPAAAWKNVGWATPAAALETLLWARATRDDGVLSKSIDVRPDSKARWEAFFARFPAWVRERYGSAEKMLVALVLGETDPVVAFNVLSDTDQGGQVLVQTRVSRASGGEGTMPAAFVPIDGVWRLQLTGAAEKSLSGLDPATDPATGERWPKGR